VGEVEAAMRKHIKCRINDHGVCGVELLLEVRSQLSFDASESGVRELADVVVHPLDPAIADVIVPETCTVDAYGDKYL
jgi:hypothetical protein